MASLENNDIQVFSLEWAKKISEKYIENNKSSNGNSITCNKQSLWRLYGTPFDRRINLLTFGIHEMVIYT